MANSRRLSPAEEEVQSYLQKVSAGQAGINPRAQTLARSSSDPAAQRIGQRAVAEQHDQNAQNIEDQAREAKKQAYQQQVEQARQQREQAAAQREERARQTRAGSAAGMATTTDVETGERSIKRHDDGVPVYKAGPVGQPVQQPGPTPEAASLPILGTIAQNDLKPTWTQEYRDDRGNTVTEALPQQVDQKTAERYVEVPDAFGRPQHRVVGTDPKAAELLKLQKEEQDLDTRDFAFKQANGAFAPKWKQIDDDLKAAKSRLKASEGEYVRNPNPAAGTAGTWGRYDKLSGKWQPVPEAELKSDRHQAWLKERQLAEFEHGRAFKAYGENAETATNHERVAKEIKDQRVNLKERQRRIELGLPADDGGISRELAEMDLGLMSSPAKAAAAVANEEIPEQRPVTPSTDDDLRKALAPIAGDNLTIDGKEAGLTYVYRDGNTIGKIDARGVTPALILTAQSPADVLSAVARTGETGGLQTYLADNRRERMSPQEEAGWVAQALQVTNQPTQGPLPEGQEQMPQQDPNEGLKAMGASYNDVIEKARDGRISIGHAETLMNKLYGDTLKTSDPAAPATFDQWLGDQDSRTQFDWKKAQGTKDHDVMRRIRGQFVNEWYGENRGKPGVTFEMQKQARGAGLPEKTAGDITKELSGYVADTVTNAAGSMLGMFSGIAGLATFGAGGVVSDDSRDMAKAQWDVVGRAGKNFNRGVAQNYEKHLTGEGKARNGVLSNAEFELKNLIENRHEFSPDAFKQKLQSAAQKVGESAYSLHELNLEDGWAVERADFDVLADKALGSALIGYAETGDPGQWESFQRRLRLDKGQRQADATMAELTGGQGKFAQAFTAGVMAPPQEMAIEAISTALTAGTGKLLSSGAKAALEGAEGAAAGTRLARLRAAASGIADDFAAFGKFEDTLAKPASRMKRLANKAVNAGKTQAVEGAGEFAEEAVSGLADPNATPGSVLEQGVGGFVGALFMGPLIGGAGAAQNSYQQRFEKAKATKQFTDWYNQTNADTAGFKPLTPAEAETTLAMVDPVVHKELVDAHATAVKELKVAAEDLANSEPAKPRGTPSDSGTNKAVGEAWQENSASRFSGAFARAQETSAAVANYVGGVVEAAQSTKDMEAPAKARTLGLLKVATGRPELLTGAERKAITGIQTKDGAPYFASVGGKDVFTAEGRAEVLRDQPLIGGLIQTDESRALVEASLTPSQPTPPNEPNQQGQLQQQGIAEAPQPEQASGSGQLPGGERSVSQENQGNPQGTEEAGLAATAQANPAAMDAGQYSALWEADNSLPDIPTVVAQARAAGQPVSPSMQRMAETMQPEAPSIQKSPDYIPDAPKVGRAQPAVDLAERVKQRVEAAIPGIKGRIRIQPTRKSINDVSGGAAANSDGTIDLILPDIAAQLRSLDPAAVEASIEQIVTRHEVVHVVQFEVVRSAWEDVGSPGTFTGFFKDWYGKIASELSPEAMTAARDIYGAEAWDGLADDANRAAELVRMLVEAKLDPAKAEEFSELFRAVQLQEAPTLIETLRRAVEMLVAMVRDGLLPDGARQHVDQVEALYRQLTGETAQTNGATEQSNGGEVQSNGGQAEVGETRSVQDEHAPMRVIGMAIKEAAANDPRLNKRLRRELEFATEDLDAVLETLPPEERRPFFDQAIRGWLDERFPPKREPGQPASVRAREILNAGEFPTLSAVFSNGKIAPRPSVISLVLARKRAGQKLTEKEMTSLRSTAEHDDAVFQNQFENSGNGRVAREILSMLMAKPGEGIAPDVMASTLTEGDRASDLWAKIGTELNQVANGKRAEGAAFDPNREWTDAEIAAAEAARAKAPEPAAQTEEEAADDEILFSSPTSSEGAKINILPEIPAAKLAGPKIDGEWNAFGRKSESLGIPRAEMPQVKADDRSALVQFLRARGVDYTTEEVLPGTLRPTQAEYSPAKIRKARAFEGGNRSLLASSDSYVVDGHHQWMRDVADTPKEPITIIRLNAPIRELLPMVMEMPSAKTAGGSTAPKPETEADGQMRLFSSPANQAPARIVAPEMPQGFPDTRAGTEEMAKWALEHMRGDYPAPALDGVVGVSRYGVGHTKIQTRRNPERMRAIAVLPELLKEARIVNPPTGGDIITLHSLALIEGKPTLARIVVEKRDGDRRGTWYRFYDVKGFEIEDAPDAYSAFPSGGDGSLLANPGRTVTLAQLSQIVKEVEGGDVTLLSSSANRDADYMAAVERGDIATAQRMVNEAAKAAGYSFGPVWHGTDAAPFEFFDINKGRKWAKKVGFWFTDSEILAGTFGDRLVKARLRLEKPVTVKAATFDNWRSEHANDEAFWHEKREAWERGGHDGVIIEGDAQQLGRFTVPAQNIQAAFSPNQIKSAEPVTRDSKGNVIPLSKRFDDSTDSILFASPATKQTKAAVDQALAAMPPMQRELLTRIDAGATEADLMLRFGLSKLGITRALDDARGRLAVAMQAASDEGLQPAMKDGKIDGGRPDLAYGAQPAMAAIDQARNDSDVPGVRGRDEVIARAEQMLKADYAGTYDSILQAGADERQLADYEVAAAKIILGREMIDRGAKTKSQQVKLAMLAYSYRDIGTETARALAMRFDPHMKPAERHAQFLAEVLTTPDAATRKLLKGKSKAEKESILTQWMERVKAIKDELRAQGIDIDASLAAFREKQQGQKEAQAESPQATAVIDETVKKLTKREKAVVIAIRSGATWEAVAFQTGMEVKEAQGIYRQFYKDINEAMAASAKRYLEVSLAASSPMANAMRSILDDLGVPHPDDIANDAADLEKRQKRKAEDGRRESERKSREKKREQALGKLVGKPDITLGEWANRPPASWRTLYETEMKGLRQEDRISFEEWAAKEFPATHREWQSEMELLPVAERMSIEDWAALPATRKKFRKQDELFRQPINETTGASERKTAIGQGELGLEPELQTPGEFDAANPDPIGKELEPWKHGEAIPGGTFDLNDPMAMKQVIDAFAIARGTKLDALMEYWKASILTGPQTHIVNAGSNLLHVAYDLLPRRGTEALINTLLGAVGQGSDRAATFKEFAPMARQLHKATQLAARNAMRSWKLESRTFEHYARAEALQLDFTGVGAEYIPPALGGKIGKIMRSLSFRAMTAADEFFKSLYAQFEVAAQSHRIAAVEEKLAGKAYDERFAELMEPGSKAWLRAIDGAQRVTFQEELDGENPRLINRLDQLAGLAKQGRSMPWIGKPLTLFLPFFDTPLNVFKQAIQMSPLGGFLAVADGIRSLRRRVMAAAKDRGLLKSPRYSPEQLRGEAEAIYDRLRFIQDLTNQTLGWSALFALQGLVKGDDDDDLPVITGTVPYKTTRRGERDNAYAVMPPMTIRIPGTGIQFSYSRIEPFATMLASSADFLVTMNRHGGLKPAVASETLARFKDQVSEKTFLQGLASIINVFEDPHRWGERITSGIVTGFVPNIIRQPLREADSVVRDQSPRADDGFFRSIAKRVGYSLAPGMSPAKVDVWGREVPASRGGQFGGTAATDFFFRVLDPTNATFGAKADPIDRWIFRYNLATEDPDQRVAIQPISDDISVRFPGEDKNKTVALTPAEQAEANRYAGQMARSMLGEEWEDTPLTEDNAEKIREVVSQAQKSERSRLRMKILAEGSDARQ